MPLVHILIFHLVFFLYIQHFFTDPFFNILYHRASLSVTIDAFVDLHNTGIYILFSVLNIYVVIPSRLSLFWERRIVVLLMDAVGLSLFEGYCVRPSYITWYVVIQVVLSLRVTIGSHCVLCEVQTDSLIDLTVKPCVHDVTV